MSGCHRRSAPVLELPLLLANLERRPVETRLAIRELLDDSPGEFVRAALPVLTAGGGSLGRQYLTVLLLKRGLIPPCDPATATLQEDVAAARAAVVYDPQIPFRLARRLLGAFEAGEAETEAVQRTVQVLEAIADEALVAASLAPLLEHPDPKLRSKAARVLGRTAPGTKFVRQLLESRDARVRANAVEGLWESECAERSELFRLALRDGSNRVVGNALLGLLRLGEECAEMVRQMGRHTDPRFRATAAWVMGASGDPAYLDSLAAMIRDPETAVRRSVFRAIARLRQIASEARVPVAS